MSALDMSRHSLRKRWYEPYKEAYMYTAMVEVAMEETLSWMGGRSLLDTCGTK